MVDPALVGPWHCLGDWFTETSSSNNSNSDSNSNSKQSPSTPFEAAHGVDLWGYERQDPSFNNTFNLAMASDSGMMNLVIGECREVFEGLRSLVDVGGGTGTVARIITRAFPGLKCTVLDLPHVVEGLENCESLKFVGGDMFEAVPSADAVLLKLMLHAWRDEDCVKVLKKCREAIGGRNGKGKVIIIDIVISDNDDGESTSTKLYFDLLMMTVARGRERTEKEWEQNFLEAGFRRFKIRPTFGLRSLIEVYP
ncbi:hypothetical protein CDL15_Pgr000116 [Punica granatum]|uniref:O-methyltransferase C-terminal domain-containing protein n=1 Tax=Punica granatum TaxID=22663 RepID=A0A218Y1L8_PUNGR|nr:hypothetical protein CDL15_Pgr000116 [Punica granatum]